VCKIDENGNLSMERNFRLSMKCVDNNRKRRDPDFNAAMDTLWAL
jgi:hypothetical protein